MIKDDSKDAGKDDAKKQLEMISELADQSAARGDYNQVIKKSIYRNSRIIRNERLSYFITKSWN